MPDSTPDPTSRPLVVWCNGAFPEAAMQRLVAGLGPHQLLLPPLLQASILNAGEVDPLLEGADVAFGQPDPAQVIGLDRVKWVQVTTAGYTRYDRADLRDAMARRGGQLTNSSAVYDEPCAEHALAMILAVARQLPRLWAEQRGNRGWPSAAHRATTRLLPGQTALLYGYGAIAQRLTEMLQPLGMNLIGVRRHVRGDELIRVVPLADADALLPQADHVIDILPAAGNTAHYFGFERFNRMKAGAAFYNIGRGTTVDQSALIAALRAGQLSAAYLDVTEPEPLPPDHALWDAPNCYITPHTAGGHVEEFDDLVRHFLANLRRYERGEALYDRVF